MPLCGGRNDTNWCQEARYPGSLDLPINMGFAPPPALSAVVLERAVLLEIRLRDRRDSLPAMRLRALDADVGEIQGCIVQL